MLDDGQTLPEPFTKKDIVLKNKRYYSTNFVVLLKFSLAQDALNVLGLALSTSIRPEVREFYKTCLTKTADLVDMCLKLKVKLGLHQPLIYLPENQKVDKINKQEFLGNFFGRNRNLTTSEVLQLTNNYRAIEVTREVCRSFSRSMNTELKAHYERGIEMCKDHLESIKSKLDKDELPQLPTWESEIDTEGGAPFSEQVDAIQNSKFNECCCGPLRSLCFFHIP
ncbi:hypothetical protein CR203_08805 [Salipaludibacillus neizhouensis]|uniref:DUF3231 domain-containing protein n=1 Tax=Salipaludibacillus neizhouensis TaxID=885475 RepID=A0A3A9KRZ5_9BACI|nr:DUF3231 family protein [Salipaludibacillus neizhouensis]RKL67446.1 hypothetical protein CR203_08805 [Salipaludibacillus neizhouensis]